MSDAHGELAVGEGCSFTPDLNEFWAADTWQLCKGESLPGLAVVREGGILQWQGLTPSLVAELKWACAHKFISHEWTLARWGTQLSMASRKWLRHNFRAARQVSGRPLQRWRP